MTLCKRPSDTSLAAIAIGLVALLGLAAPAAAGPAVVEGSTWQASDMLKIKVKGDLINEKSLVDSDFTLRFGPQTGLAAGEMEMIVDPVTAEPVTFRGTYVLDAKGRPITSFAVSEVESVGDAVMQDIFGTALDAVTYTLDLSKLLLETKTREKDGVEKFKPKLKLKFAADMLSGSVALEHKVIVKFQGRGLKTAP